MSLYAFQGPEHDSLGEPTFFKIPSLRGVTAQSFEMINYRSFFLAVCNFVKH